MLLALKMKEEGGRRKNADNWKKLEKFRETDSAIEPSEGMQPYQHLDFRLLATNIIGE